MSADSLDVTPEMALLDALKRVREPEPGKGPPSKAMVILLWDDDGKYDIGFNNAGMKFSEMVALCEVHKARCLQVMNRPEDTSHDET